MSFAEDAVEGRLTFQADAKSYGTVSTLWLTEQISPNLLVFRRDLQMEMEAALVRVNLFRVITAYGPAINERNEFRGIVCGHPFRKMLDLHAHYVVKLEVAGYANYL